MIPTLDDAGRLNDAAALAAAFTGAGLQRDRAAAKAELVVRAVESIHDRASGPASARPTVFFVPGRIEVLGKHTDYCGGSSLLAAAEQGFVVACVPREDRTVRVCDIRRNETIEFALAAGLVPAAGHWSNYPMTVARRLARNFPDADRGAEIAFGSDLPPASGMSSSSAMIVSFFLAFAEVNRIWQQSEFQANVASPLELASYLATIENGQDFGPLAGDRGVGTAGGSEDHTAILCCRPGTVSRYAYCPARHIRDVSLPRACTFVIASSGVAAEKTGEAMAAYNRASRLAGLAAEAWREATGRTEPHLAAAIASQPDGADEVRRVLESAAFEFEGAERRELLTRFEHFCRENEWILPAAVAALEAGDLRGFARLVDDSQAAAEDLLGNQIAETRFLAAEARRLGAIAASAFGAGFGGSVWALVPAEAAGDFQPLWAANYAKAFPQHGEAARFFPTAAGPSAVRIT